MSKKNIFYLANSYVLILLLGIINVISAQSLPAPILIEPVDWANIDSLAPTFRWEPVAGALTYQIQISTDKSFQQNIIDTDTITYTQFTSSPLDTGVTYFWQVRAKNLSDTSPWSSVFRLRINGINLTDRLVAYYPFNGNPEDSVGNSDGTLQGDVALAPDRYGKADHAYSFDGNDDYITLPESEAFKSIDREITVSAWINPNSLDFESGLIHRDRFWRLFFYSDGSVVGNIFNENGSENRTGSSTKAPLNQWSHVAFTYDRQHIHVYLNGEHCGQLEFPVARIGQQNISSIPVIGKGFGLSQNYFNGIIDDIRIYDRALTDAEMAELYRDKEPPETPQLTYPENGAINDISLYQSLNWDPIWNAANYHVQLSTVQDFSSLFYDDSTLKNNSVVVGPLTPDQMYYWRVRAQNSNGISAWSDVRYFSVSEGAETVYFYDADANEITLGNNYYELTLLKSTGAIVNIIDKTVDRIISVGIREEHLWRAELFDGNWSGIFVDSPDDTVSYEWDAVNKILIFNYLPNLSVNRNISAQVFFKLSDDYYFDLQISMKNESGGFLYSVDFPFGLEMDADQIEEAILPLMPGAKFNKKYFEERHSGNIGGYPTALVFADYIYFKVNSGQYGMYTIPEQDLTPNIERGLNAPEPGSNNYWWLHSYKMGLPNELSWTSPLFRFRIGQDELQTAVGYRYDTGLNNLASLQEKLGDKYQPISQSIWNQLDIGGMYRGSGLKLTDREKYNEIWNLFPAPSIIFVTGWETGLGGSDARAPDIFPVDSRLGTDDDFRIVLDDAHQAGHLIMPYINTTIWNANSPTVQSLQPAEFAAFNIHGNPIHEHYNNPLGLQDCYSTSPYAPTVINRIGKVFSDLQQKMPISLVFEDQIGPRGGLDFNPLSPTPAHYPQGWLEHTRRYQHIQLTTEFGYDRLIETHVTFLGNLVLWDRKILPNLTWGGYCDDEWGSGTWEYYPIVPIMAGDKIIFQSMSADSPTNNKPILTWDMAMKQMLGYFSTSDNPFDHVWRNTATSFQKYVISRYFDERMLDYTYIGENATKSQFATHEVVTNWSTTNTFATQNHIITTEGYMVISTTQDLVAGIFTNYNGLDLSAGDHYIIETRYADSLVVRYPQGDDTPIRIDHRSLGPDLERYCFALTENGAARIPATVDSQYIHFNFSRYYNNSEVNRYLITAKPIYLSIPTLVEPTNWTTIQEDQTTFKWEKVPGAINYLIQIAAEDTFQLSIIDSSSTTQTEYTSTKLIKGTTYFWRVRANNATQTSDWSVISRFRVDGINIFDRLTAYYPLDGNSEDNIGNSHGTLMGEVTPAPDRFNNPDMAYSFDGHGDYITFPESRAYTSIEKQITVSAWINPVSVDFEMGVMIRDRFWRLMLNGDGSVFGNVFNEENNEQRIASKDKTPIGKWTFVAFTYDCQTIKVYINGVHSGELKYSAARIGEKGMSSIPTLGKGIGNTQRYFKGSIDEVRVYDRTLSSQEIAELHRRTSTENFPPEIVTFSPAIDTVITEGDTLEFLVEIKDEDNDTLFCTWFYDDTTIVIETTTLKSSIIIPFPKGSVGIHRIKASVSDGKLTAEKTWNVTVEEYISAVQFDDSDIPTEYSLEQNYPNPFNPRTTIRYELPRSVMVALKIYDILGREVLTLVNEHQKPGRYAVSFDASNFVSGVYFYKLQAGSDFVEIKKMLLLR